MSTNGSKVMGVAQIIQVIIRSCLAVVLKPKVTWESPNIYVPFKYSTNIPLIFILHEYPIDFHNIPLIPSGKRLHRCGEATMNLDPFSRLFPWLFQIDWFVYAIVFPSYSMHIPFIVNSYSISQICSHYMP